MATNTAVCSICDLRHLTNPSTDWCPVCEEALCVDCKEHHSLSKGTRDHKIIPIAHYQKLPQNIIDIKQYCEEHGDKYQLFCKKHDRPICSKCTEIHGTCGQIMPLDNVIANIKQSTSFEDLILSVKDLENNIKRIKQDREINISSIADQKKKCQDQIQTVRRKINQHLDKIEEQLIKELSNAGDQTIQKIKSLVNTIEQKEKEIAKSEILVQNIKEYASDLQTFLATRDIQSSLTKEERYLQSLVDDGSLDQVNISCSINSDIQNILTNVQTFGSVQLKTTPSAVSLIRKKDKEAQIMADMRKSINDIKIRLVQAINLSGYSKATRGCCITPRDYFLFACHMEDVLIAMNPNGSFNFSLPLKPCYAFSLRFIDDKTVAVTSDRSTARGISIVDLTTKQKPEVIHFPGSAYGLTSTDTSIVVCVEGKGIQFINRKDFKLSTFVESDIEEYSYVAEYNNNLYFTSPSIDTVTCCDIKGQIKWEYKTKSLLKPYGIAVDSGGNVYVAGGKSVNVIVISPDGKQERQLLTKDDGLTEPTDLFFDRPRSRFLVTNRLETTYLFDVL